MWWLLCLCILAPRFVSPLPEIRCGVRDWTASALRSFKHYARDVAPSWQALTRSRKHEAALRVDSAAFRRSLGELSKQQCLVEYVYSARKQRLKISRWLKAHGRCDNLRGRSQMLYVVLNSLIQQPPLSESLLHDFRFWYDLTDSTVLSNSSLELISYPVLSFGRAHDMHLVLPTPELYIQYAVVADHPKMMKMMQTMEDVKSKDHVNLAKSMRKIFRYKAFPTHAWHEKRGQAVYRGSCFPTFNPWGYETGQPAVLFLRGEVCEAGTKDLTHHLFDVGLNIVDSFTHHCDPTNTFYTQLCKGCRPCSQASALDRGNMTLYKYQLAIDGYGPTFDSIYWKLASNSVVFMLVKSAHPVHLYYNQWFSPLLQPNKHYIPVTVATLEAGVQWCVDNDDACREIAEDAYHLMRCYVTMEAAKMYLIKALQLAHDTQNPAWQDLASDTDKLTGLMDTYHQDEQQKQQHTAKQQQQQQQQQQQDAAANQGGRKQPRQNTAETGAGLQGKKRPQGRGKRQQPEVIRQRVHTKRTDRGNAGKMGITEQGQQQAQGQQRGGFAGKDSMGIRRRRRKPQVEPQLRHREIPAWQ